MLNLLFTLRYRAVCSPFSYSSSSCLTSAKVKCVYAWMASLALSVPIKLSTVDSQCYIDMSRSPWLLLYLPIICFFLPLGNILVDFKTANSKVHEFSQL